MQTVFVSCAFGIVCAMGLWAAISACATRDEMTRMLQRAGKPLPPEEV